MSISLVSLNSKWSVLNISDCSLQQAGPAARRHSSALQLLNGKMGSAVPSAAPAPPPTPGEFYKRTSAPNLALPAGIPFDPDCQVTSLFMLKMLIRVYVRGIPKMSPCTGGIRQKLSQ